MSNPQWKSFQPPITSSSNSHQDIIDLQNSTQTKYKNGSFSSEYPSSPRDSFANISSNTNSRFSMGTFNASDTSNSYQANDSFNSSSSNNSQQYEPPPMLPNRETGIIEKLLHSYGFIQCCERQARLFFHFSQFSGNIEHLKIGDPVEFEMTYDRRTGKPIASTVTKIAPEVVLSEARVTGTVTTELKSDGSNADTTGRISYENRGECFFLPYTKDDVEGNVILHAGDAVSFQIATNQRGNLGACHVRLENPAHPVKYHGVVCSMKESFGFIERADVVKEIFFHFSEAKTKDEINLGDDVEFIIQTRNGKEVACYITRLPSGSVIFEDVLPEIIKGQVLKPLERGSNNRHLNDPLPGRIRYRAPDHSEADVQFGDKDQCGEFTLRHGDWVQFQVAIDRRDSLKRATNISLLDESFQMSGERREMGIVSSLKDGFGFIKCVEREPHLFFHFSEVLQPGQTLNIGDEVEFTLDPVTTLSASQQPSAKRIKHLPKGTVQFETVIERGVQGVVSKEAIPRTNSPSKPPQDATGLVTYQVNGAKKSLTFFAKDVLDKSQPRQGERVVFDICQVKRTKEMIGMNVSAQHVTSNGNCVNTNVRTMLQGFIAALKDGFGFIETKEHDKEVFFRFSNFEGSVDTLELGRDVEYIVSRQQPGSSGGNGGGCCSAELVRALPKGSIPLAKATNVQLQGTVTRALRALNPDQLHYSGIIDASNGMTYQYGIMGLTCKRDLFRVGDQVSFFVDTENRAVNIIPMRKKRRAIVDSIKGAFGFLSFEIEEGKKLIFYMSEVNGSPSNLSPGDLVEFTLVTYHHTGKSLACNVTKVINFDGDTPETIRAFESMRRRSDSFDMQEPGRLKITHQVRNNDRSNNSQNTGFKNMKSFSADQPQLPGISEGNNATLSQNEGRNSNHNLNSRIKKRAKVDSLKGNAGFIEESDGKKVLFYMSEVRAPYNLQSGDIVEYQTMMNRNGKVTAVNVTKVVDGAPLDRPEHLKTRRRTASLDEQSGPRFQIIRKPRGPDGSRGFRPRVPLHVLIADTSIQ